MDVRPARPDDESAWSALYRDYRAFYALAPDEDVVARVWSWVLDPMIEVHALVADHDGALVGLAHHRPFRRPSSGTTGTYLDDLFVAPSARRRGVGAALLTTLGGIAAERGHSVVCWITAADNHTARRLYDAVAQATPWLTYDLRPA